LAGGQYGLTEISTMLRRLERPVVSQRPATSTALLALEEGTLPRTREGLPRRSPGVTGAMQHQAATGHCCTQTTSTRPRSERPLKLHGDESTIYLAAAQAGQVEYSELETAAILANYQQVRQYLHNRKLSRGWDSSREKGRGKGGWTGKGARRELSRRPQYMSKEELIAKTRCARCGAVGHWARTCTNPPDPKGQSRGVQYKSATFMNNESLSTRVEHPSSAEPVPITMNRPRNTNGFVLSSQERVEEGHTPAGNFVIDTGSEVSQIGIGQLHDLCEQLATFGLTTKWVPIHTYDRGRG
jgi:hypothetical protein